MQKYAATVEVATKDYDSDAVMSRLEGFNTALGFSPRGWASATLTVPADLPSSAGIIWPQQN